jgi:hypothetical protein
MRFIRTRLQHRTTAGSGTNQPKEKLTLAEAQSSQREITKTDLCALCAFARENRALKTEKPA